MDLTMPRLARVSAEGPSALRVTWKDGAEDVVELAGWIAAGGAMLAPLSHAAVFGEPKVATYGAAVTWGDEDGDLAIDAHHLRLIALEQRPFGAAELAAWQGEIGLSNQEAADLLQIAVSRYGTWKAGTAPVPALAAMLARAVRRDPVYLHAHYRPRRAGRPRKAG